MVCNFARIRVVLFPASTASNHFRDGPKLPGWSCSDANQKGTFWHSGVSGEFVSMEFPHCLYFSWCAKHQMCISSKTAIKTIPLLTNEDSQQNLKIVIPFIKGWFGEHFSKMLMICCMNSVLECWVTWVEINYSLSNFVNMK